MSDNEFAYKNYKIERIKITFKYAIYISMIVLFIIGLITRKIVLFNRELISEETIIAFDFNFIEAEIEHYLFTVANSLIFGFYIGIIIPQSGRRNIKVSFITFCIVIAVAVLSLGYLGVYLLLNFDFLPVKIFVSNQKEGIEFFIGNIVFFTSVFASSFLIQSEID